MKLEAMKTSWFSEGRFVVATSQKKEVWGRSMSFPARATGEVFAAIAPPVFAVASSSQTAREFSRENARAAAEFSSERREPEPNQRLEPTRWTGAVFPERPLRSTVAVARNVETALASAWLITDRSAKAMSTPAILFLAYLLIGLLLMIAAIASPGKEKRTKGFESGGSGDAFDAGLLLFIAVLWPVWLLTSSLKKDRKP
jgi:hypothetical protein